MIRHSPPQSKNRDFSFVEEVLAIFSFLTVEFNFSYVSTEDPNTVRFKSTDVFVEVRRFPGHDPSIYFLGVELGPVKSDRKITFDLIDLMRHAKPTMRLNELEKEAASHNFQATTLEQTQISLARLASLVKTYAGTILSGDGSHIFGEMTQERNRIQNEIAKEKFLKDIRSKAEVSFKNKNYAEVVALYELMQKDLLPSETGKLSYAKKHIKKNVH